VFALLTDVYEHSSDEFGSIGAVPSPNIESRAAATADVIWKAWSSGDRIAELPADTRPRDIAEGMAAQLALRPHAGATYGWKIAATSTAGQAHIGVDGPLPGLLFERFRHEPGDTLPSSGLHMRKVEAEFAFRMRADVEADASAEDVLAAVDTLHLTLEVPDSRFSRFESVGAAHLTADCACASRLVVGPAVADWRELDLSTWPTALWINGEEAASGSGAAVLGAPTTALAWIAVDLRRHGLGLKAGDLVTTGTTTAPPTIGPGDAVRADFGALGELSFTFAP
jgi:2-keto-4-pentenoate hydratase